MKLSMLNGNRTLLTDEKTRLSLKLRIIEKRKKAGSNQKSEKSEIESALYQAVQAAYISLLLEVLKKLSNFNSRSNGLFTQLPF